MSAVAELVVLEEISADKAPAIYGQNKLNDYVAKAREADQAHKQAVLTAAKEAVMLSGVTEDQARSIINMIRRGEVPSVSIAF